MKYFKLLLLVCVLYACGSNIPFSYNTYHGKYTTVQIDSIFKAENLPTTSNNWVKAKFVDYETNDTILSKVFYRDLSKESTDSIVGVKYTHRVIDTTHYFIKQILIDNSKRNKK